MRKPSAVLLMFGLLLAAAPCPGQEVIEEIVAVVNDEIITLSEARGQFEAFLNELRAQNPPPEQYDKQRQMLKDELLNIMIQNILLLQRAKELDINVGEQIRTVIESIKKENNLASDDEFKRALQQQGVTYDSWVKQLEQEYLRQAVIYTEVERSIVLDDAEVVQYYRQHPEEFRIPEEYKLRAVYLSQEGKDTAELEALRRTIDEKVAAGEDFAALAGEYSDAPLKESQGDLGLIKKGELDRTLEEAVEKLEAGGVSGWIEARNAWYLIKLEEKTASRLQSFEEIKDSVQQSLFAEIRGQKLEEYINRMREESYVKILKPDPFDY
jgi:peptidyl-prolyl cis-trans isomerase SurA